MRSRRPSPFLFWSLAVVACAFALFGATTTLDLARRGAPASSLWDLLTHPDPNTARYAVSAAAQALAAILGILITVALIVVQLNANRFSPKVIELFVNDPRNLFLIALFVFSIVYSFWVVGTPRDAPLFAPEVGVIVGLGLMTVCLAAILPYIFYLFEFLRPMHVMRLIREETTGNLDRVVRGSGELRELRRGVAGNVGQLSDMAKSSVQSMDSEIALEALDDLREVGVTYLGLKDRLDPGWYQVEPEILLSFSQTSVQDFQKRKIWVEAKLLSEMGLLMEMALGRLKHVVSAVAGSTRALGGEAMRRGDGEALRLVVQYFNTYLRMAINRADRFSLYHVLYHYRLMIQEVMERYPELAEQASFYFSYYGTQADEAGLRYILETACHDLRILNESVHERGMPNRDRVLEGFLDVGRRGSKNASSRAGVYRALAILGSYYLWRKEEGLADRILEVFARLEPEEIASLRDHLLAVSSPAFWEMTDRGMNWDYVGGDQRAHLVDFFRRALARRGGGKRRRKPPASLALDR